MTIQSRKGPLIIGGDGRADSPGHSAKYGTYSVLYLRSGKVMDVQLVQVRIGFFLNDFMSCIMFLQESRPQP